MNEQCQNINIYMIHQNPYQVRHDVDEAAVMELAANIEKNGLLQPITLRPAGDQYEIAFGHTRRAAFKLLEQQGKTEYKEIPAFVRELDDLQMFEMAVAENIKRRDLNPIERALAMKTYMETFKKTSAETGEFFNVDEATVRGAVRLLGLPKAVQVKVAGGEINISAARSLLTLQKIAPEDVETVSVRIVNGGDALTEVADQLRGRKNSRVLQEHYQTKENPTAGDNLWRLDLEKFPDLPLLTTAAAQDAGAIGEKGGKHKKEIQGWINSLAGGLVAPEALIAQGAPRETVEKLAHLLHPPACLTCEYHVLSNRMHVCGWKGCWQRKLTGWLDKAVEKASKELGIPAYDPEVDGEYIQFDGYRNSETEANKTKWFDERIPGLRLVGKQRDWGAWGFTHKALVQVVDVTPEHVQASKDFEANREKEFAAQQEERQQNQREREANQQKAQKSNTFTELVVVPIFSQALETLKSESLLKALVENSYGIDKDDLLIDQEGNSISDPKVRLYNLRCALISGALDQDEYIDFQRLMEGPEAIAQFLVPVAAEWGVSLPSDWFEKAAAIQIEQPEPEKEGDEEDDDGSGDEE